jgi:carbonic anhydrase
MFNMKKSLALLSSLLLASTLSLASDHKAHWGYTGHNGPQSWGELSDKYKMCGIGMNQSPINIVSSLDADLEPIGFNYKTSPVEILNNGHTVQVNVASGSIIEVDGVSYELKQYHFHTPSENNINSKSFPLEAHFVHADKDGNLAVVGVMFEEGKENAQLKELWAKMPMEADVHTKLSAEAKDINALLPESKEYYRFNGSLTTPPCSEGVKWMVLETPLTISKEQVEKFSHAVHGHNNRPIQSQNARIIVK